MSELCDDDDNEYSAQQSPLVIRHNLDEYRNYPVSWEIIELICGWNPTKVST